jgi:hypothetical protein
VNKLTAKQRREIEALRKVADNRIDTVDIPEAKDWSSAKRGKFFRPGIASADIRPVLKKKSGITVLARTGARVDAADAIASECKSK